MQLTKVSPESAADIGPDNADSNVAQKATLKDPVNPQTQKELLDRFRNAPIPMPRTQPELFQLLANYHPHVGWDKFVETIDFTGVTPRQMSQVVLGRHPGAIGQAVPGPDYNPRRHFREMLVSKEFRQHSLSAILHAYPSKGRDVFIHVPKCAGTDLILNLGARSVSLPKLLEVDGWIGDVEFVEIIAGLARAAAVADRLFVFGHMELGGYVDRAGIRPDDRVFTVLRDPIDLMVSQANYAIGRVRQDPVGQEPDAAEYLCMLGLTHLPNPISIGELKELTHKALLNPTITKPNRACFFLGRGSKAEFAIALENLIIHNVEITTTENYDRWLNERWGIGQSSHHNRSDPILPNSEARRTYGPALAAASAEDQKLYDLVSWALQQAGTASITGQDLARLVGPLLTKALSDNQCPPLALGVQPPRKEQKILVAESPQYVEMYLAPMSVAIPAAPKTETIITIEFGKGANGDQYRLDGWAPAEPGFTWTGAEKSTIRLPALAGDGCFIVRIVATPYIAAQLRPFQQVDLLINDVGVGGCQIKSIAVIEAEVPAEMLHGEAPLTLTLRLPTAVRPSEIGPSKDQRQLALAVRSLTVLRVPSAAA
jgi:hypothetical protein